MKMRFEIDMTDSKFNKKTETVNEQKEPLDKSDNDMKARQTKALDKKKRVGVDKPTPKKSSAQRLKEFGEFLDKKDVSKD